MMCDFPERKRAGDVDLLMFPDPPTVDGRILHLSAGGLSQYSLSFVHPDSRKFVHPQNPTLSLARGGLGRGRSSALGSLPG